MEELCVMLLEVKLVSDIIMAIVLIFKMLICCYNLQCSRGWVRRNVSVMS